MSFDIGSSSSKSSGKTTTMPKAPAWVEDPTKQLTAAIMGLGNKPSSSYVTGASPLQTTAFNMAGNVAARYGVTPAQTQPVAMAPQQQPQAQQGLFASLNAPAAPDYNAYLQSNPDVAQWATASMRSPHFTKGAGKTAADYDGNGVLSNTEMAQYHYETTGKGEGRQVNVQPKAGPDTAYVQPQPKPQVNVQPQADPDMGSTVQGKPQVNGGSRGDPERGGTVPNNPQSNYNAAGLMAMISGNSGPNLAETATVGQVNPVTAARVGQVNPVTGARVGSIAPAISAQVGAVDRVTGARVGSVAPATSAQVGNVDPVTGARVGAVDRVTGARVGDVGQVSGATMGSESLLKGLQSYMDPYTNDVVNTTLTGFDTNAERLRARQAAAGAGRGAFGGSRYAIGEAVTEGELARERASSEAGLRSSAFNTGAALSGQDADRRQQAGALNAQMAQQAALANQQSELSRILAQAGYDQQAGLSNQNVDLSRAMADAGYSQQAGLANQQVDLSRVLQQSGFDQQTGLSNQNADLSRILAQAGYDQQAGLSNQQVDLSRVLQQSGFDQQTGLANQNADLSRILAQAGYDQQAGLANQEVDLSRTLSQAGFDQQAGLQNQQSDLSRMLAQAGYDQQGSQFNAGQRDNALTRQLQASGVLANIGATQQGQERADIAQIAGLGDTQRGIEQDFAQADLQQLSAITQLLQQLGLGQFIGSAGTETSKTKGSTFGATIGKP